ncbi:hypothetical protein [Acidomonas methanolica]|uniref:Uncharacterized protein n=1 Tax=Acidomonas methanolica NBRC 104435 TaxID=1231351 RepID=A0A023D6G6_ACIMT|nr:hypothetical protein [Acidomonas methanolica]TCS24116.1 hypothetical protein EDC31_12537 [Acidomonas methanolica]GAJ29732.1 hypothetical protein Amme_076_025 [Acidomonas methanolica NBRC 104435]GBQ59446.1 hypothetical protein AA0498_2756 [Acidomonas methanolica]GEL00031.1 hypothetical protein AME01nite_25290 [Acidomonas methanolica NBRC 104435]
MQRINLSGGSYDARAVSVAAQRVLNLYAEPVPQGDGEPIAFAYYPTPGLIQRATLTGPIRCLYQTTQGDLLAACKGALYLVASDGATTLLGAISDTGSVVRMCDNGTTLFVVDGNSKRGWYCTIPAEPGDGSYGTLTELSDAAWYGSPTIAILDTFFLFVNPDTTNWYTSPAQFSDESATPFDSLYVASDTTSLSTIVGLAVLGQYIWLFGRNQVEFWYDSGASDFPFQRVEGVTVESGCISPFTICTLPTTEATPNGGIMWLGRDRSGYSRVFLGQLTTATPVSTFPVDGALQDMGDLSGAAASVYQQDGHVFYVLTIPGQSSSWVYDASTKLWHERCALDSNGNEAQIRPWCYAQAYGSIWAGDYENGAIYQVSLDAYDDAGTPIKRQRSFPHLLTNGQRAIHRQLMLDMQCGGGQTVSVDWSDDRGQSFVSAQTLTLGTSGNTWPSIWRLGLARDRVYRLTWTAPGVTALMGVFLQIDPVRT